MNAVAHIVRIAAIVFLAGAALYFAAAAVWPRLRTQHAKTYRLTLVAVASSALAMGQWFFGVAYAAVAVLAPDKHDARYMAADPEQWRASMKVQQSRNTYVWNALFFAALFAMSIFDAMAWFESHLPEKWALALPFVFLVPAVVAFVVSQRRLGERPRG